MAIALFYAIAVITRYVVLQYDHLPYTGIVRLLVDWASGVGPCLGALAAVLICKRRFYCSIIGTSLLKSVITVAIPFTVIFVLNHEISYIWLAFVVYSFLEEVGWRGYLQGELKDMNHALRVLVITGMWFFWHIQISMSIGSLVFFVIIFLGSWGIGLLARDTHSLTVCACLHTLGNFSFKGLFEFTPGIIALYVAVFIIWHLLWYVPWSKITIRNHNLRQK